MKGLCNPSIAVNGMRKAVRFLLGAILAMLCIPLNSHAQDTGYISGTVTDNTGAAVAATDVTVQNVAGSITRTTTTNSDGAYVVAGLTGDIYNITATAKGFQKYQAKNVVLPVAQKARIDIQLTIGAITEEVVVTGENLAQVETQSSELGATITGKQINELMLNGRNFTQLVTLSPGVVSQTGQEEGTVGILGNTQYSINGGRTEYNNWELDGGDNMDNGSNTTLNVYPSLEAIAEFKVLTSNYGAQYGKSGSGTVEVEIKPGTNQFHGSAFYYGRNDFFNANSWANNAQTPRVPRPPYKKHDFGYTVGGPVFIRHLYNSEKKKTFFFWSQEWRREKIPGTLVSQNVPSAAERAGNFNDVCPVYTGTGFDPTAFTDCPYQPNSLSGGLVTPFANNTVPTPFSSTANALLALIPNSNGFLGTYATGQSGGSPLPAYIANPSYPMHWREELIRVDHNFTDNERLSIHYIHDSWGTIVQGPLWGQYLNTFNNTNTNFLGPTTSFVARLTSTITPTLLNEFVASYTDDHILLSNLSKVGLPAGGINLVPLFSNGLEGKVPAFSVGNTKGGAYGSGGFSVDTGYFPWKNANPTYTYRDTVTKTIRNHTLFFGGYFVAAQKNQSSSVDPQGQLIFSTNNPNTSGNPFADLLIAQIGNYNQNQKKLFFYDRYKIFETFFQDDWRVTRKLTLNLGLRWSFFGRYQEKHNQEFGFSLKNWDPTKAPPFFSFTGANAQLLNVVPGTSIFNGLTQCGASSTTIPGVSPGATGCMQNKWINPGPRLGFAYDPFGDGKWAIRGGYGIFFEHMNGNEANAEVLQGSASPLAVNGSVSNISGYENVGGPAGPAAPPSPLGVISIPDQVRWPYVQQWNLGVEHQLPANVLLSVAYVGSKGTHLSRQYDANQLAPVPAAGNPFLTTGAPIVDGDCQNFTNADSRGLPTQAQLANGTMVTGQAVANLFVACGNAAANYYRKFQGVGTITRIENSANSIYNALQVSARRTVGAFTVGTAYTYSHSIDNSSDRYDALFSSPADPRRSRASSNFDIRHAFSASFIYSLPFFKQAGLAHSLLGGWQVSGITTAISGAPFTVTNATTRSDNAGIANGISGGVSSFPNLIGDPYHIPAAIQNQFNASGQPGVLLYNPAAFALPTGLTFGNTNRNQFRLPGRLNFDFGLFKRFTIGEHSAFELRWENFNVFNHTQFSAIGGNTSATGTGANLGMGCVGSASFSAGDPSCASTNFLVLTGAHNPRIMQFGLRFYF